MLLPEDQLLTVLLHKFCLQTKCCNSHDELTPLMKDIFGLQALAVDGLLSSGASVIGVLRNASCISAMLNTTLFDTGGNVTLGLFDQTSAVDFAAGIRPSWTAVSNCVADAQSPKCNLMSASLIDGVDYFVVLIYGASAGYDSMLPGGFYLATFKGMLASKLSTC